jgi:hypothetical protein
MVGTWGVGAAAAAVAEAFGADAVVVDEPLSHAATRAARSERATQETLVTAVRTCMALRCSTVAGREARSLALPDPRAGSDQSRE